MTENHPPSLFMTHEEFIAAIGAAVQKLAPDYGISVCSPVIAQAILESAWGTSPKAARHNYFGLKYRANRLTCHSGTFVDDSSEQLKDGTYIPITDQWYAFDSIEAGVEGYFQFIDTPNYAKLKGLTDPYTYLVDLKAAGYATSQKYVENLWRVIQDNDLQRYDTKGATMANSSLATYANITANHSGKRTARITKITPHYMAAYWTGRQCADYFAGTGRQASSNYCVGVGGDIAVSVPEDCRAWTSSSNANDQAAVTIECGNNADSSLPQACYNALVRLCADICKRHGINPHYDGTPNGSITMHKMFASTACPGNWLSAKITSGQFERDIKNAMGQGSAKPVSEQLYRVRKTWGDVKSQIGAYKSLENAKKACGAGYTVFDKDGKAVYTPAGSAAKKWTQNTTIKVGDKIISVSCGIAPWPGTNNCIKGNLVYVPALGGGVPLSDVEEAADTGDGKKDDYLANSKARVFLLQCTATAVDAAKDLVKLDRGYWVKAGPLMALR